MFTIHGPVWPPKGTNKREGPYGPTLFKKGGLEKVTAHRATPTKPLARMAHACMLPLFYAKGQQGLQYEHEPRTHRGGATEDTMVNERSPRTPQTKHNITK